MTTDMFGNVHLGYVVIETEKFDDWKRFGREAIGMQLDEMLPDILRFRLDANECRFLLRRGPAEDVVALGWHLDDHAAFDEICRRVVNHGVPAAEKGRNLVVKPPQELLPYGRHRPVQLTAGPDEHD